MNKLKTKFNDLTQDKLQSSLLFTALLTIYQTLAIIELNLSKEKQSKKYDL